MKRTAKILKLLRLGTESATTFSLHVIFSFMAYVFGGLAAITSFKLQKQPMSTFSVILGAFLLLAIIILASGNYLSLGLGGIERMVAYPLLLWLIGLGSYLITKN